VPYPASCRPQAWSAAAAVAVLQAALGLQPDVPAGELGLLPVAPLGALSVKGLRIAGHCVDAAVDRAGQTAVEGLPAGLRIVRHHPSENHRAGTAAPAPVHTGTGKDHQ
jgi:hypothetical protein